MVQVKKAEVRERMLEAAAGLFAEHGYARATINQIAKRSGMAPSNAYVYSFQGVPRAVLPTALIISSTNSSVVITLPKNISSVFSVAWCIPSSKLALQSLGNATR
jgi:hypothetical protein